MFDVQFTYFDDKNLICENINKIVVESTLGVTEFTGECILSNRFHPSGHYYLFSDTKNYTVSTNNLRSIEIMKK